MRDCGGDREPPGGPGPTGTASSCPGDYFEKWTDKHTTGAADSSTPGHTLEALTGSSSSSIKRCTEDSSHSDFVYATAQTHTLDDRCLFSGPHGCTCTCSPSQDDCPAGPCRDCPRVSTDARNMCCGCTTVKMSYGACHRTVLCSNDTAEVEASRQCTATSSSTTSAGFVDAVDACPLCGSSVGGACPTAHVMGTRASPVCTASLSSTDSGTRGAQASQYKGLHAVSSGTAVCGSTVTVSDALPKDPHSQRRRNQAGGTHMRARAGRSTINDGRASRGTVIRVDALSGNSPFSPTSCAASSAGWWM